MLAWSHKIWQQAYRTAGSTFGAIMFAFGLSIFLLLAHSGEAQAHERNFDTSQNVSAAKLIPSANCKRDTAISTTTVLSASIFDEPGCHDGAFHTNCDLCANGHCFGCSAAVLAAAPGVGFDPGSYASVFLDQKGLTLSKSDEAFRPPRSIL